MTNVQQANVNRPRQWRPSPHTLPELANALNRPYRGRPAQSGAQ